MKKITLKILAIIGLTISTISHAIITKVESLYHPATKQTLLLAHDTHLDYQGGNITQRQQDAITNHLVNLKGAIVVEEKTAPPKHAEALGLTPDSNVWQHYKQHEYGLHSNPKNFIGKKDGMFLKIVDAAQPISPEDHTDLTWQQAYQYAPMHQLTNRAKKKGIYRIENVECRFVEFRFPQHDTIITAQLIDDGNNGIISMINGWQEDPTLLQEEYANAIQDYLDHSMTKYVQSWRIKNPTITAHDLIKHQEAPDNAYGLLATNTSRLLDAVLLHKIYDARYEPVLFSLCGSEHYTAIRKAFINLGYVEQKTFGYDDWSDNDESHWIIPALDMDTVFNDVRNQITINKVCNAITPLMPSALSLAPFPVGTAFALV